MNRYNLLHQSQHIHAKEHARIELYNKISHTRLCIPTNSRSTIRETFHHRQQHANKQMRASKIYQRTQELRSFDWSVADCIQLEFIVRQTRVGHAYACIRIGFSAQLVLAHRCRAKFQRLYSHVIFDTPWPRALWGLRALNQTECLLDRPPARPSVRPSFMSAFF